jgi:hypothetical protein
MKELTQTNREKEAGKREMDTPSVALYHQVKSSCV